MASDETKLIVVIEAEVRKLNKKLDGMSKTADRSFSRIEKRSRLMEQRLGRSLNQTFRRAALALSGALSTRSVLRYADAWTEAENKLAAATRIAGIQAASLDDITEAASAARSDLGSYVDLYSRMLRIAPNVAATQEDVARATDIVSKAFKAGGAATSEQISGIMQLGQALQSGILGGDELRTVRENAPLLAAAIARGFNTTIGGLKKLGEQGELTAHKVFRAILEHSDEIEAAFEATTATISDAMTKVENEFIRYIGVADDSVEGSRRLVAALNYLAENFQETADAVVNFALILAGGFAGKAAIRTIASLAQMTAALAAFLAVARAGTITMAGLGAALTASLGPIGFALGAAAAAIYMFRDGADEAATSSFNLVEAQERLDQISTLLAGATQASGRGFALETAAIKSNTVAHLLNAQARLRSLLTAQKEAETKIEGFEKFHKEFQASGVPTDSAWWDGIADKHRERLNSERDRIVAEQTEVREELKDLENFLEEVSTKYAEIDNRFPAASPINTSGGSSKKSPFRSRVASLKDQTTTLEAERAALESVNPLLNDYGFATERAKAAQQLLSAAQKSGMEITDDLKLSIAALSTTYASAHVKLEQVREAQENVRAAMEEFKSTSKEVFKGFISDLREGKSATEALGNALDRIGDKLVDMAIDKMFEGLFAGIGGSLGSGPSAGTGGGVGAGIFHRGGQVGQPGPIRNVPAAAFAGAPRFHNGANLGLRRNEIPAILERGEVVLSNRQVRAIAGSKGQQGQLPAPKVSVTINNNAGVEVQQQSNVRPDGGVDIDLQIDRIVAQKVMERGSEVDRALQVVRGR